MVRLARLVRSKSGRFEENYEVKGQVLGEGMSGGVIVGKNKKTDVTRTAPAQNWREIDRFVVTLYKIIVYDVKICKE